MTVSRRERRAYPRRGSTWSVVAAGVDTHGLAFECAALLHDISEGGIFMRIACCVKEGSRIHTRLRRADGPQGWVCEEGGDGQRGCVARVPAAVGDVRRGGAVYAAVDVGRLKEERRPRSD